MEEYAIMRDIMLCIKDRKDKPMLTLEYCKKLSLTVDELMHYAKILEDAGLIEFDPLRITLYGLEHFEGQSFYDYCQNT
jgi:hypothetical protein